jgi:hypothetical protein
MFARPFHTSYPPRLDAENAEATPSLYLTSRPKHKPMNFDRPSGSGLAESLGGLNLLAAGLQRQCRRLYEDFSGKQKAFASFVTFC